MKRIALIAWARYHRRSESLAQHLGASLHYIYHGQTGRFSQAPVRYLLQAWRTWLILRKEQPAVVFVQNPPIFTVVVVSLYAQCYGASNIIDSHTGAFVGRRWHWSVGLHHILSRGALMTIVHNESQEKLIQHWGCPHCVIGFIPGDYPTGEPYPLSKKFNVAVICGFFPDEPLEILIEAASHLKEVCFYLTGDSKRIDRHLLRKIPENICITGYLSYELYIGLLRGVDAIMDLVNNEYTLLMGAFEAVSLGVPLIVSDWPLLRNYFSLGTIYIPNTIEGICEGVYQMQSKHTQLRRDILLLRDQLQAERTQKYKELKRLLENN